MATELLALGTTAAASSDIVIASGESAHIHLRGSSPPAVPKVTVAIEVKGDDNGYTEIHRLNERDVACVIEAPGTYRVRRSVCEFAVAVDQD